MASGPPAQAAKRKAGSLAADQGPRRGGGKRERPGHTRGKAALGGERPLHRRDRRGTRRQAGVAVEPQRRRREKKGEDIGGENHGAQTPGQPRPPAAPPLAPPTARAPARPKAPTHQEEPTRQG